MTSDNYSSDPMIVTCFQFSTTFRWSRKTLCTIFLPPTPFQSKHSSLSVVCWWLGRWWVLWTGEPSLNYKLEMQKNFNFDFRNTLNIPRMYLHRYLRYTPALAVMILFYVSFTKFLGSGPFFNPPTNECEQYWWSALLHVSIYTNPQATVRIFNNFENNHWQ